MNHAPNSPELPDYETNHPGQVAPKSGFLSDPRKRRLLLRLIVILTAVLLLPPLYRAAKGWRARQLLAKSASVLAVGDAPGAVELMKQAFALAPGDATVLHGVELYNARSGDRSSLEKLLARMRSGASPTEELLGIAELEAAAGLPETTRECLSKLPQKLPPALRLRRSLVEARLLSMDSGPEAAAGFLLKEAATAGKREGGRLRVQAALYMFSENSPAASRRAAEILLGVVSGGSDAALPAWRLVAQAALLPESKGGGIVTPAELKELPLRLASLGGTKFADRLLAADLEVHADPSRLKPVAERLGRGIDSAPRAEKLEFARWLNNRGLHGETMALAGAEAPRQDTDWLLVVLDARSQKGEWREIPRMMDSPAGAGIPEAVRHLYLARAAMMTGNGGEAEEEWRHVGGALALEKTETLAYIAGYEEQIGLPEKAARTYREMANRKESAVPGLVGMIRCQAPTASASSLIPMYEELVSAAPSMTEARGDLGYLKLLRERDRAEIEQAAAMEELLLTEQPDAMARISAAALGRLRLGNIRGALDLYEGRRIDWEVIPEPWKAVRVAVLSASGDQVAADRLTASIDPSKLRPEERDLLSPASRKGRH